MSVTPTRTRNPRGQGDQLRIDLLEAATELMAELGSIRAVTLRAVAARVGVSPTAVYRHFADHDELLKEAVLWCWSEFDRKLDEARTEGPLIDCFWSMGRAYVNFATDESGKYTVMFNKHLDFGPEVQEAGLEIFLKLVDLVRQLLEANGDDRDPFFVATQVHTWMHGIVDLCARPEGHEPDAPWPEVWDLVAQIPVSLGLVPTPTAD